MCLGGPEVCGQMFACYLMMCGAPVSFVSPSLSSIQYVTSVYLLRSDCQLVEFTFAHLVVQKLAKPVSCFSSIFYRTTW